MRRINRGSTRPGASSQTVKKPSSNHKTKRLQERLKIRGRGRRDGRSPHPSALRSFECILRGTRCERTKPKKSEKCLRRRLFRQADALPSSKARPRHTQNSYPYPLGRLATFPMQTHVKAWVAQRVSYKVGFMDLL